MLSQAVLPATAPPPPPCAAAGLPQPSSQAGAGSILPPSIHAGAEAHPSSHWWDLQTRRFAALLPRPLLIKLKFTVCALSRAGKLMSAGLDSSRSRFPIGLGWSCLGEREALGTPSARVDGAEQGCSIQPGCAASHWLWAHGPVSCAGDQGQVLCLHIRGPPHAATSNHGLAAPSVAAEMCALPSALCAVLVSGVQSHAWHRAPTLHTAAFIYVGPGATLSPGEAPAPTRMGWKHPVGTASGRSPEWLFGG